MCELFAMSSRAPSRLTYSLNEFAKRGGLTHSNRSGWGVAFFQEREALLIKEPEPASDSPWVKFIAEQGLESDCVIAHVRLATVGQAALHNTHPFRRALGGRVHVFAHNGTLKGLHDETDIEALASHPVGDTDSELAFCLLLDRLQDLWAQPNRVPPLDARLEIFAGFARDMAKRGSANFLYADSDALFVHGDRRIYEEDGVFSEPRAPGLSMRDCLACGQGPELSCDGLKIGLRDQKTILFASVPLEQEGWTPLPERTVVATRGGEVVAGASTAG